MTQEVTFLPQYGTVLEKLSPFRQRCIVVYQPANAPSTTEVFVSPEDALAHLQQRGVGAKRTGSPLADGACVWMDLQGGTDAQNRRAVQLLFPSMQPSQMDAVLLPDAYDVVELQPVRGQYLVGSLACSRGRVRSLSAAPSDAVADDDEPVLCSFACDEQCVLTMHATPFVGLAEVLHHIETEFGARGAPNMPALPSSLFLAPSSALATTTVATKTLLSATAVLCALICYTSEAFIPDLTPLISEVDCIDEMVMLVAPGERDQADLFRRVALLRRRIAEANRFLYMKEKLLNELIGPTMRTTFVSRSPSSVNAYKEVIEELLQVLERLENARDTLNHANLNFVNAIAMRMSQASAGFDYRMMFISQIATICLPMNLIASVFAMNLKVAWVAGEYDNLNAFWSLMAIMLGWCLLCLFPFFRAYYKEKRKEKVF